MKNILLLILILSFSAFATMNVVKWRGCATTNDSSNWNNATNWIPEGVPTSSDSVVLDSLSRGSVKPCSLTANAVCSTLVATVAFTGGLKIPAGKLLIVSGKPGAETALAFQYDGTILTINDTIRILNGDFHLGNTLTSTTIAAGKVDMRGNGYFDNDETGTYLKTLKCAYPGKTVSVTSTEFTGSGSAFLSLQGGTFVIDAAYYINKGNESSPWFEGGATTTINGAATLYLQNVNTTFQTDTLPAITCSNLALQFYKPSGEGNLKHQITGAVSAAKLVTYSAGTVACTTNTLNNPINVTGLFMSTRAATAGGTNVFNAGSSVITAGIICDSINVGNGIINKGTATYNVSGNYSSVNNGTVNAGTSLLNLTGTSGTQSIKSFGKSFYDIVQNGNGGTVSLVDKMVANTYTLTNGNFTTNAQILKTADDQTYNGSGNITLNYLDTITNGDFIVNNSGTRTTAACSLFLGGNSLLRSSYKKTTLGRITFTDNKTYTYTSGDSITISARQAGDISGGVTGVTKFQATTPGSNYKISFPAATSLTYFDVKDCFNFGTLCSAYAVSDTSRGGNTNFYFLNTDNDTTYRDSGSVVMGNQTIYYDTLQVDSIVGYRDTTLNWVHAYREYSTIVAGAKKIYNSLKTKFMAFSRRANKALKSGYQ
jgi:hypothetical protein